MDFSTGLSLPKASDWITLTLMSRRLEVALIRHGQSTANASGVWQGRLDFPLSDKGRAQARLTGESFAAEPPDAIYTSPLSRAHETARLISAESGHMGEVVTLPGFVERHGGLLEGTTAEERAERHPDLMEKFANLEEDSRWALVGAETDEEVLSRFTEAMENIAGRHNDGGRAVVVSHGGSMRAFLRDLFGPDIFPSSQRTENTSITRFIWGTNGEIPHLLELGSTGHLSRLEDSFGA